MSVKKRKKKFKIVGYIPPASPYGDIPWGKYVTHLLTFKAPINHKGLYYVIKEK